MKKQISAVITVLCLVGLVSAATPDKDAIMAKVKAAWQAYKDKKADEFKKLVDKDLRCVYPDGILKMQNEVDNMSKWDIKSFTISDFDSFTDEPDVIVATYKVAIEGTFDGKDVSGNYNAGDVWKKEKGTWLAIFHTGIKMETGGAAAATPAASP